jgi:4-amino-4-deoxy-L-arabinose transferase-like glycosyltransferase
MHRMKNVKSWIWLAAAGLVMLQVILVAVIVHGESPTYDEGNHIFAGYMMWHSGDYGLNPEHPPLVKLIATLPLLGKPLWVPPLQNRRFKVDAYLDGRDFLERNDGPKQRLVFRIRLAAIVFAVGLSAAVFLAGLEWFGAEAALLALILVVFDPNVLANSGLVTTDIGVTCFLIAGLLCFYCFARRPSAINLLLAGLAAGCALAAKHSGVLLAPMLLGLVLCEILWAERGSRWRMVKMMATGLAGIAFVAIGVLWASYGFRYSARPAGLMLNPTLASYSSTLQGLELWVINHLAAWRLLPESYLMGLVDVRHAEQKDPAFILGHSYAHGVWWYFPVTLAIKSTLGLIGLAVIAVFAVVVRQLKQMREVIYLVLPGTLYLAIAMHGKINIGVRHVLPLYALTALLVGAGAWALIERNRRWKWVVGVLMLGHIVSSLSVFPAEIAYANEAWGGPSNVHKYLSDANVEWGQQLLDVKRWVDAHPGEECWFAYVAYPVLRPEEYGIQCHHLPTADSGSVLTDAPPIIRGNLLVSADNLEACELPSQQLNPYRRLRSVAMTEQIDHGVFVYRGEFQLPEVAALSKTQEARILLGKGKAAEALKAAQEAVALEPDGILALTALGDAATALNDKDAARSAYRATITSAKKMEPDAQDEFVPGLEKKLSKLDAQSRH